MKNRIWLGTLFVATGLLLVAAALILSAYNRSVEIRAGDNASDAVLHLKEAIDEVPESFGQTVDTETGYVNFIEELASIPEREMPVMVIDGQEYIGILEIPTFELELPVMKDWSYDKLKTAPCRYNGSAYLNNFVIAAHNYTTHFGSIHSLKPGDYVLFTDCDGNKFIYEVAEIEVLSPDSVEDMKESGWALTLFTCTLGGQNRVTVRCEKVESEQ